MEELVAGVKVRKDDKQDFYSQLIFIAREKAYNPHWASHKYREKFGVWPRGLIEVSAPPTMTTLKWIKSRNIKWSKGKNK